MLTYLFAVLAAVANASSSVLQRKANREESASESLSWRLVVELFHKPVWFAGILGLITGFLLQVAALSHGALAVVEPVLILELPITVVMASVFFHRRLHRREWTAIAAITAGLVGLLYFLDPSGGVRTRTIPGLEWGLGVAVTLGVVAGLVGWSRQEDDDARRAAILGLATGITFGLTAALMKAMSNALSDGFLTIFSTWQTYTMVATGVIAMFLLQSALNAGALVAAQPGFSGADPLVSILWGILVFGEQVRTGWWLGLDLASAAVAAVGVVLLSRSPLAGGAAQETEDDDSAGDQPKPAATRNLAGPS